MDNINPDCNEGEGAKEDSFQLDPLLNPNRRSCHKGKINEDTSGGPVFEKRKGLSTGHQKRRKKLKPKDKIEFKVSLKAIQYLSDSRNKKQRAR